MFRLWRPWHSGYPSRQFLINRRRRRRRWHPFPPPVRDNAALVKLKLRRRRWRNPLVHDGASLNQLRRTRRWRRRRSMKPLVHDGASLVPGLIFLEFLK